MLRFHAVAVNASLFHQYILCGNTLISTHILKDKIVNFTFCVVMFLLLRVIPPLFAFCLFLSVLSNKRYKKINFKKRTNVLMHLFILL